MNLLKKALKQKQEPVLNENIENYSSYLTDEFLNNHPILRSIIKWYRLNELNNIKQTNRFLVSFIDNLINNISQSPNNFRHSEPVKNFAMCLYVLGGKQVYEFIRLNLYGAIPCLSTLGELINNSGTAFNEAQFNFENLRQCHSDFGFCSEDTTGVIRKVEYDSKTDCFVGFATPVNRGVPLPRFYRANTFNDLKTIYDNNEIAGLLNVHMFQGIPTEENSARMDEYIPTMFEAECPHNRFCHRALSGSFSTMVNFTVNNFIQRAQKLCILNQMKHNQSENGLSFPVHHKHKHDALLISTDRLDEVDTLNLDQIISDAYNQAIDIVRSSNILLELEENDIINLETLNKFVYDNLKKSSKMFNYSSRAANDNNEELESDDDGDDEDNECESEEGDGDNEICDELLDFENNDQAEVLNSTKSNFDGIKLVDNVNPLLKHSYFKTLGCIFKVF
ncbi:unnamed protein product [Adineta steineri]|uniref:Uncharacterized protein n=1 Tax=Adineta steineri TaxID=433720 RepID=A0A815P1N9_9BILA|nr:unnamed protein product [Adineta steineri]